jgi:hypothetical protein
LRKEKKTVLNDSAVALTILPLDIAVCGLSISRPVLRHVVHCVIQFHSAFGGSAYKLIRQIDGA